ncbi:MAG: hypothetical protein AABX61_02225 [Nanoarchaeota archaeon]
MNKKFTRSEGEELIEEYLNEEGINFKSEIKIENLKGDSFPYRKADFYLPQYKVYVEFFGRWNVSEDAKNKYREKKNVYEKNNVPCFYLYPDSLGILNFIFKRRLKEVLKKHNKKWQLFKINWNLFQEKHGLGILIFILLLIFSDNLTLKIISIILTVYLIIIGLKSTFFK